MNTLYRTIAGAVIVAGLTPRLWAQDTESGQHSGVAPSGKAPQTIMIFWVDRIEENGRFWAYERVTEENRKVSWVAKKLEEALVDEDDLWEVIVSDQHEVLKKINEDFARLSGQDYKIIRQIAADHGAQYYIVGYSHAIGPQRDDRTVPGEVRYYWKAFAYGRMYRTDTGKIFASPPDQAGQTRADLNPDWGRIEALRRCGELMTPKFVEKLKNKLGREAGKGRSVTVTVLNAKPNEGPEIKKAIQQVAGSTVDVKLANGVLTARCMSKVVADELAAKIAGSKFEGFALELVEAQDDAIRFEVKRE